MAERPEIISDFWALYHLDITAEIWGNRLDLIEALMQRLAVEPYSLWRAKQLGGTQYYGWTQEASLNADLVELMNFNISACAVNKKARFKTLIERPGQKRKYEPKTVKDMNLGAFFTRLSL